MNIYWFWDLTEVQLRIESDIIIMRIKLNNGLTACLFPNLVDCTVQKKISKFCIDN